MKDIELLNFILAIAFVACSFYAVLYTIVKLVKRPRKYAALKKYKYAVLICARNEENVIGNLIESIKHQDYDEELVDIYVVADNCDDKTAEVARSAGATVIERFNKVLVGKGYAMSYFFDTLKETVGIRHYDGYFVFDADNLLDEKYITEMNKVFSNGYKAVTSYRNTKNYGDSWVSACYGMWFLKEAEYMNYARSELGISAAVSGTGFLFSSELVEKNDGWNYHLLTEDLEFTADMITNGEKIGYCHDAIFFDEQPTNFKDSLVQRSRWTKGGLQVMGKYGKSLIKETVKNGSFSCYDMLMGNIFSFVLTFLMILVNGIMFVAGVLAAPEEMGIFFSSVATAVVNSYILFLGMGLLIVFTEWKRINCEGHKKILYSFMFPFFALSFVLALGIAVVKNVDWKPIKHSSTARIGDMKRRPKKSKKEVI